MRRYILLLLLTVFLFSCRNNKTPDVSNIKINLTTQRFEQDFFAADSANFPQHINELKAKYPRFLPVFFSELLETNPAMPIDTTNKYIGGFLNLYKTVYDSSQLTFKDFTPYQNEIVKAFQYINYYFPDYKLPTTVVTYIAPIEGTGNFLMSDYKLLGIGLEHYLGKNYPLYKIDQVQETYPAYVSARFEPSYIAINSTQNILSDIYPEKENDDPLITQMIEKGKRLYILSKLLPATEEYKLIGYTDQQLKDCYKNEAIVWNMFIQNSLLQEHNPDIIKNYIGESPKTQALGEGAPGNLGSFSGWQIVKKYMSKNEEMSLKQLMSTDDEKIFQEAKYKP
ncbi:gliding motility lipoprotein GldB [Ferruginibacter albus]|uniref:gliding motility lipoprotein GldB n=1 Tax=Ferruginibacter albus TaxID=2875540 RepID=UPI001CC3C767|nr:hypothetical protein [Ferruginibacter albus]UAY51692.1 hypothetical protein K9M53_13985 [Ferruginibacter albus]